MESDLQFGPERRRCLRQQVHAPAFASFDGATGGMILDLSEEGLSMQMGGPFEQPRHADQCAQRLDLIAYEAAERGALGGGVHVGDDERAQGSARD